MRCVLPACLVIASCGGAVPTAQAPVEPARPAPPAPVASPPAARGPGPLSTLVEPPKTPWPERTQQMRKNEARKLGNAELRDDVAAFEAVIRTFYVARTPEQDAAVRYAYQHDANLPRLAPYSVTSTFHAFLSAGERLGICVRPPGETWPCNPPFVAPPESTGVPYTLAEPAPGIVQLSVTDLRDAGDPGWARFDEAARALDRAKGIVIDLRGAAGADPRPLVPWLERVTGRQPLRPLRAIVRPPSADRHVAEYTARYLPEGRDRAVWATLVGPSSAPATPAPSRPIVVVVDQHCGPACELVARVLEAYAGADLVGGAGSRLHRDEAALVTLPHSEIDVLFHASEYLLAEDIEAVTGPTHAWRSAQIDHATEDYRAAAVRLVALRLQHPSGWPARCDAFPAYATRKAMPEPARSKIDWEHELEPAACEDGRRITVTTTLPPSALHRYLATCAEPVRLVARSLGNTITIAVRPGVGSFRVLSQLAQSELVARVDIECEHRSYPD